MPSRKDKQFQGLVEAGLRQVESTHHFLCEAFAEVLRAQGLGPVAELVESRLEKAGGGGIDGNSVQAISFYFQLLNLAEEHVAQSIRRTRESRFGSAAEPGLWPYYFERLKDAGLSAKEVRADLRQLRVEPVFTKHPTEAKRWSVLGLHREVIRILDRRETERTPRESQANRAEMRAIIERLWLTGEIFHRKPSVEDELDNLLYYLSEVFPAVFSRLDANLTNAWQDAWPEEKPLDRKELPALRFGSWVGGDRDGHPLVTAEVTARTLSALRSAALRILKTRLGELGSRLSFTETRGPLPGGLRSALKKRGHRPAELSEPWAVWVGELAGSVETMRLDELHEALSRLEDWLREIGATHTIQSYLIPLQRLVDSLGLHLARLDVRQNSAFYEKALSQMMEAAGIEDARNFGGWEDARKLEFLNRELRTPRPLTHASTKLPAEASEVRQTFSVLAGHIERHGPEGVGALIISMTRNLADLLTVYVLAKEAGLTRWEDGALRCRLPVVPLFETYGDLEAAPGITDEFLAHPCTRHSLKPDRRRTPARFMIMLGYSDSNKDTGILASQWILRSAQKKLIRVGKKHGIGITFFHGRGGTVGRGAGPTHRFLEALPPESLATGLRLTEQGEVIAQKYNTPASATMNLELLSAGTLGAHFLSKRLPDDPKVEAAMEQLVNDSRDAYRKLLEHPEFMTFYRQATPIDAIELSRIGSRPARRTGRATLEDLRAIPWVFSWNQSRFYLPGWFGVGSALESLSEGRPEQADRLRKALQTTPFLRYVFYNVESSLSSSDEDWMRAYAGLVPEREAREAILSTILEERNRTRAGLESLFSKALGQRRPRFVKTLREREIPLDALHARQIELLRQARAADKPDEALVIELLRVINAIASGLRTTG